MSSDQQTPSATSSYPRGFSSATSWQWPLVPARELLQLNYGRALKAEVRQPGAVPVYGTNGQCGWHNLHLAKGPGLILGRKGQGPLGVEWCDDDFWVIDTAYYATTVRSDVDLKYLYHLIRYVGLNHLKDGTSNPTLAREVFGSQLFPLPSPDVQRSIVNALQHFDDRITLLRETNATLEAIAQALFKSWFVDFDPVRAKMAGRAPEGMDETTAALFPDALVETELGVVPKGWQFGTVGDIARLKKGTVNPGSQPDAMFEHFSLPAFDDGCRPVFELGEAIKSNKTPVPSDAVLLSKLNPHIPRVWLPVCCGSNAVCSTEFLVFQPVGAGNKELIYCAFSSPDFILRLQQLVTGTSNSHQRIKPDQVALMSCVVPPKDIASQFELSMRPVFERVHANREQAQTLASLRDALLPRLISGQLRITDIAEEVAA